MGYGLHIVIVTCSMVFSVAMQLMRIKNWYTMIIGLAGIWTPKRSQKVYDTWCFFYPIDVWMCHGWIEKTELWMHIFVNHVVMMLNKGQTIVLGRGVKVQITPCITRWLALLWIILSQPSWHQAPWTETPGSSRAGDDAFPYDRVPEGPFGNRVFRFPWFSPSILWVFPLFLGWHPKSPMESPIMESFFKPIIGAEFLGVKTQWEFGGGESWSRSSPNPAKTGWWESHLVIWDNFFGKGMYHRNPKTVWNLWFYNFGWVISGKWHESIWNDPM